jgi:hypothetical protein
VWRLFSLSFSLSILFICYLWMIISSRVFLDFVSTSTMIFFFFFFFFVCMLTGFEPSAADGEQRKLRESLLSQLWVSGTDSIRQASSVAACRNQVTLPDSFFLLCSLLLFTCSIHCPVCIWIFLVWVWTFVLNYLAFLFIFFVRVCWLCLPRTISLYESSPFKNGRRWVD